MNKSILHNMPAAFDKCYRTGGKVRTQSLSGGKYRKICYPSGGGRAQLGHVATKKGKKKGTRSYRPKRLTGQGHFRRPAFFF